MHVLKIDHVHVEVRDREVAAEWYARILGLRRHAPLATWADDPMGPLILEGGDGTPTLSLFARGCATPSRDATIAFRVSGSDFLEFRARLGQFDLMNAKGAAVTSADVVDHDLSWSIYSRDPDRNRFEVTTYDYADVARAL
ncbi:hypothetical protein A8B78_14480 [Jannaschia sp. EhC01]|nr:hypothetical protein A8B78_14480 [Jannaschia sp. EhC01]